MRRLLFLSVITLSLFLGACQHKTSTETNATTEAENQNPAGNPYISDTHTSDTPSITEDLSGKVITLSSAEFIERICDINNPKGFAYKGSTPCLVDFYAGWCGPCMKLKPIIEELAKEYKGELIVYSVNVDKAQDVCGVFGIESIPTLLFFSRTAQPMKIVGYVAKPELKTAIDDFLKK